MHRGIIAKNFSKSAQDYEKHTDIQKKCADILIEHCADEKKVGNILEIGCGTGRFTRLLHEKYKRADITAIDVSVDMVEKAREKKLNSNVRFMIMDAESIRFNKKFDLITANACFQWLDNFDKSLECFSKYLTDEGEIVFSIYGPDTFKELKKVVKTCFGRECFLSSSRFMSLNELERLLRKYFRDVKINEKIFSTNFSSLWEFLQNIKKSGARGEGLGRGVLLNRSTLGRMEDLYKERFGEIRATHQVYFYRAWK